MKRLFYIILLFTSLQSLASNEVSKYAENLVDRGGKFVICAIYTKQCLMETIFEFDESEGMING